MAPFPSIDRFNGPKIVVLSALLLVASLSAWHSVRIAAMPIDLPQFVLFLFLIASIVTSMISSQDIPSQLFGRLGRNSGLLAYLLFAILFLLVKLIKRDNRLETFLFSIIGVAIPVEIYALLQIFDRDPIEWGTPASWIFSFLGNPNHLSSFLAIAFFTNIYLLIQKKNMLIVGLNMILILAVMYANESLQGFIIIIVLFWFLLISYTKKFLSNILFLTGVFALVAVVLYSLFDVDTLPDEARFLREGTFLRRKELWTIAVQAIFNKPITGYGYSAYETVYLKFRTEDVVDRVGSSRSSNSAHNEFLEILVNGGVVVAIPYFILILLILGKVLKNLTFDRQANQIVLNPLFFVSCIFIGSLIHNLVSPLSIAMNSILSVSGALILYSGKSSSSSSYIPDKTKKESRTWKFNLIPVFTLISLLTFSLTFINMARNIQLAGSLRANDIQKAYSITQNFPALLDRYILLAEILINKGDYASAKSLLEEAVGKFPDQQILLQLLLKFNLEDEIRNEYEERLRILNPLYDYRKKPNTK